MSEPQAPLDDDSPGTPRTAHHPRRVAVALVVLLALAGGVFLLTRGARAADPRAEATDPKARRKAPPPSVVTAAVSSGDIGDQISALGTVTALHTVTVRTRIDGQLDRVFYREGQHVSAGQVLAQIDPRPYQVLVAQAEGQMARDQALLEGAENDLERYRPLAAKKAIPQQQLASQETLVRQYRGVVAADQAQVDNARLQLSYCRITAPQSGRIGLRLVDAGNMVHAADQNGVAVITAVDPITVVFSLPEDSLPPVLERVRAGADLPVEARDRGDVRRLALGRVLTIDNQIDPATGTVKVKALFPNPGDALFPNQFVNARVLVDTVHGAVLVPSAAIQRNGTDAFVYVVGPDHRVQRRAVAIGIAEPDRVQATSGVTPGETVVVDGFDKLQDGVTVSIAAPGEHGAQNGTPPRRAPHGGRR